MTDQHFPKPGYWTHGSLPPNVRIGSNSVITGDYITGDLAFKRFNSRRDPALIIGAGSTMEGVLFDLGSEAYVEIGNGCFFQDAFLICESEIRIGNRVTIGWHTTIVDSDFHPVAPSERLADTVACSPLGKNQPRPPHVSRPVVIGNDVWIGPNATILKGVRIGAKAVIQPGAVVTRDVPPGAHALGNPAQIT